MKVLVTGANGYLGKHVTRTLQTYGHEIIALDHSETDIFDEYENVTYIRKSIFDLTDNLYDELGCPDACIHLAWKDGFIHNSDAHIEQIQQHFVFLKYLVNCGLSQLIVMGTMHEIGYWEGSINENTPCNPASYYGIAKNALRQLLMSYMKDKNTILQWIRAYYIMGDDKYSQSIFSKILKLEDEGEKLLPFTSGRNMYDFIDVNELAIQISAVALQKDITGIINCCSGLPVSLKDQVTSFILKNGLSIELDYGKYPDREYDSPAVWGDATKINMILSRIKG